MSAGMRSLHPDVAKFIGAMSQIYGRALSADAAELIAEDLAALPPAEVMAALKRCRLELRTFPTIADIMDRMPSQQGAHPGVEEAWATMPTTEEQSVVWTTLMRDAFAVARPLLERDEIAARMAFKETYTKLVGEARAAGQAPVWEPSLGQDPAGRELVIREAVRRGRLTAAHAQQLLPHYTPTRGPHARLTGPAEPEPSPTRVHEEVTKIINRIKDPGADRKVGSDG